MSFIEFKKEAGYAIIKLNRVDKYNSFIKPMAIDFQEKLKLCKNDTSIRAILLTANGKAFCAGQDLKEAIDKTAKIELIDIVQNHYNPIILMIRELEKPVVCGVNGVAAGAGANIALSCDITIAAESANFIQAFSKIGLIPDSGGTFLLPRLIGMQRAAALSFLGNSISAKDAESMGMIYQCVADNELEEKCLAIVKKLASMPTKAIAYTKKLLSESYDNQLEDQLKKEAKYQEMAGNTFDFKEGVNAFLEKRNPIFKGK